MAGLDELEALAARLKEANEDEELEVTESELVLMYTCHYIADCFGRNGNGKQWHLRRSNNGKKINADPHIRHPAGQ